MKLLLDAHTLLWLVAGDPKLSTQAKTSIADPANVLLLSVESIWELAIKTTKPKQKLELSEPLKTYLTRWTTTYQINVLAIEFPHALKVAELADHHRDPFDRILIAQAMVENMALVSGDEKFNMYPVPVIW